MSDEDEIIDIDEEEDAPIYIPVGSPEMKALQRAKNSFMNDMLKHIANKGEQ